MLRSPGRARSISSLLATACLDPMRQRTRKGLRPRTTRTRHQPEYFEGYRPLYQRDGLASCFPQPRVASYRIPQVCELSKPAKLTGSQLALDQEVKEVDGCPPWRHVVAERSRSARLAMLVVSVTPGVMGDHNRRHQHRARQSACEQGSIRGADLRHRADRGTPAPDATVSRAGDRRPTRLQT